MLSAPDIIFLYQLDLWLEVIVRYVDCRRCHGSYPVLDAMMLRVVKEERPHVRMPNVRSLDTSSGLRE